VPFVSLSRAINIRPLTEARAAAGLAPGWSAIFTKAFAMVAKEETDPAHALCQMAEGAFL